MSFIVHNYGSHRKQKKKQNKIKIKNKTIKIVESSVLWALKLNAECGRKEKAFLLISNSSASFDFYPCVCNSGKKRNFSFKNETQNWKHMSFY